MTSTPDVNYGRSNSQPRDEVHASSSQMENGKKQGYDSPANIPEHSDPARSRVHVESWTPRTFERSPDHFNDTRPASRPDIEVPEMRPADDIRPGSRNDHSDHFNRSEENFRHADSERNRELSEKSLSKLSRETRERSSGKDSDQRPRLRNMLRRP